jgi:hypothetical protein
MSDRLKTVREHLRVTLPDRVVEVRTRPFDYDLYSRTAARHSWPDQKANPVGFLLFIAWSAARHDGAIEATMTYEAFRDAADDIEQLVAEDVDPTGPASGDGPSPG